MEMETFSSFPSFLPFSLCLSMENNNTHIPVVIIQVHVFIALNHLLGINVCF